MACGVEFELVFVVVREAEEGRIILAAGAGSVWAKQHKLPLSERCAVGMTPAALLMPAMHARAAAGHSQRR